MWISHSRECYQISNKTNSGYTYIPRHLGFSVSHSQIGMAICIRPADIRSDPPRLVWVLPDP
jgi:hypothetical protein